MRFQRVQMDWGCFLEWESLLHQQQLYFQRNKLSEKRRTGSLHNLRSPSGTVSLNSWHWSRASLWLLSLRMRICPAAVVRNPLSYSNWLLKSDYNASTLGCFRACFCVPESTLFIYDGWDWKSYTAFWNFASDGKRGILKSIIKNPTDFLSAKKHEESLLGWFLFA